MYTKLTIRAYSDPEYQNKVGGDYKALINPEGLNMDLKVELNQSQPPGTDKESPKYVRTPPSVMNFDLLFDATGVVQGPQSFLDSGDVSDQIDEFLKLTFTVDGQNHEPKFLILVYGTMLFKGRLEGVSAVYKLFDNSGKPLRAVVKCTFRASKSEKNNDWHTMPKSPDLTHIRVIKQGDTLPLLCNEIYKDTGYYMQVAEVNGITNFRNLKVGSTVYFPPLKK